MSRATPLLALLLAALPLAGVEVTGFNDTSPPSVTPPAAPGELTGIDAQSAAANAEADAVKAANNPESAPGAGDLVRVLVHSGVKPDPAARAVAGDHRHDDEPRHEPERWQQVADRYIVDPPWRPFTAPRGMPSTRRMYQDNDSLPKPAWKAHAYPAQGPVRF